MRLYPTFVGLCVCGTVVLAQNGSLSGSKTREQLFTAVGKPGFKEAVFTPDVVTLVDDPNWQDVLRNGGLTLTQPKPNEFKYIARLNAERLNLPERDWDRLEERGLPNYFSIAALEMTIELSQPWSERAFQDQAIERIELNSLNLALADMTLTAKGSVLVDEDGKMYGAVSAYVTNWRRVLDLFDLPASTPKKLVETFVGAIADGDAVEVKFDILDGQLFLGAMPVANIPPIRPK